MMSVDIISIFKNSRCMKISIFPVGTDPSAKPTDQVGSADYTSAVAKSAKPTALVGQADTSKSAKPTGPVGSVTPL